MAKKSPNRPPGYSRLTCEEIEDRVYRLSRDLEHAEERGNRYRIMELEGKLDHLRILAEDKCAGMPLNFNGLGEMPVKTKKERQEQDEDAYRTVDLDDISCRRIKYLIRNLQDSYMRAEVQGDALRMEKLRGNIAFYNKWSHKYCGKRLEPLARGTFGLSGVGRFNLR